MTSLKEKNLNTLFLQNKDKVVEEAFFALISDNTDNKKEVRENITSSSWFDGEGILKLSEKLMHDIRGGWGRAKRNAILSWYIRRPLSLVKEQIALHPKSGNLCHEDVVAFLHMSSYCKDEERYYYFLDLENKSKKLVESKKSTMGPRKKTGFWSFVKELLDVR